MTGKKVSAVKRNVIINNTKINNGPCVLTGSIASFLSLSVNEPAIARLIIIGKECFNTPFVMANLRTS